MLTLSTSAALYFICYLSKKITTNMVGSFLARYGKESLHIMALHLVGFKIGIEVLNLLGADIEIANHIPKLSHRIDYIIILFLTGVLFPMAFIATFREIKSFVKTS